MKKALSTLALALAFSGTASAQSLFVFGNGGFLTATTMISIDTARKQFKQEQEKREAIAKKREENRQKKALQLARDNNKNQPYTVASAE